MSCINIAIDGPSGAGKSTISKEIAKQLGYIYIDTGAMYRTIGVYAKQKNISLENIAEITNQLKNIDISIKYNNDMQRMYLNGADVTDEIRLNEISMYASKVSAIPEVRGFLLDMQRELAQNSNCIMDGRDIGTVVLPGAQIKIFLTASDEDRAKRRYDELVLRGEEISYEKVLSDIRERDERDSSRDIAPLKPADDAVIVDTSGNTFEQSVERIKEIINQKKDGDKKCFIEQ